MLLPFVPGRWSPEAVLWGGLSGVAGCLAIALLYACLAIGPMSILSPLTAVISALVPLGFGLARGEQLGTLGFVGLGLALVAVVLVGFVPEKGRGPSHPPRCADGDRLRRDDRGVPRADRPSRPTTPASCRC